MVAIQMSGLATDPIWPRVAFLLGAKINNPSAGLRAMALNEIGTSLLFVLVFCRMYLLGARGGGEAVFRVVAAIGLRDALYASLAFALDPGHIL